MRLPAPRLGFLLLLPVLAGCSPRVGHVSGKVTYHGSPVPAGYVQFRPADPAQNSVTVELKEDGSFEVDLPAGEVAVSVDNREWEPPAAAGGGIPAIPPNIPLSAEARAKLAAQPAPRRQAAPRRAGKYVPIPARYYDLVSSDARFTVQGGAQAQNIELTD